VTRISWERLAAQAGLSFVVLYVVAFSLGIEVGDSDREILAYYANSGHRAKEIVAFFLIAGAALALVVFATALRSLIARAEQETAMLAALAWAGGSRPRRLRRPLNHIKPLAGGFRPRWSQGDREGERTTNRGGAAAAPPRTCYANVFSLMLPRARRTLRSRQAVSPLPLRARRIRRSAGQRWWQWPRRCHTKPPFRRSCTPAVCHCHQLQT